METIGKFIKALFFSEDGEMSRTTAQKVKDAILWMIIGSALTIGVLFYCVDDEPIESELIEQSYDD